MNLNDTLWIRYSYMGALSGGQTIIEVRKDYFVRVYEGYIFEENKEFTHWKGLDDQDISALKNSIKRVDFLNLNDKYVNLNVMDGGSSDFEIFDDPITKKIHECNYYHQDPYLVQLNKVVTLLYKFQKYFPAKEVKTSKKAELWKSKSDLIDLMNLDIPTYLRRKFSTEKF